jgi:hypothetical protein
MILVATFKQQHWNVLEYLTSACDTPLHGEQPPSLLPTPTISERAQAEPTLP